jgi:NADPH-dependent curcumin reductase CurA
VLGNWLNRAGAPGETVVVTAAAGAVGSVAGQLAKANGAHVVGAVQRRLSGGPQRYTYPPV